MNIEYIVNYLLENNITISTMESCTGGLLANLITDVCGAGDILKFSAITYSNEFKIKMGVSKEVIDKYSVYSKETAKEMAYNISKFTNSDIGVGITGKLACESSEEKNVDICIYDNRLKKYYHVYKVLEKDTRKENKLEVINEFIKLFISTIIV